MGGCVVLAGRAKDTIVLVSGENIEPAPIEDAICVSPLVKFATVVGQDCKHLGALLVPDADALADLAKERGALPLGPILDPHVPSQPRDIERCMPGVTSPVPGRAVLLAVNTPLPLSRQGCRCLAAWPELERKLMPARCILCQARRIPSAAHEN